MYLEEVIIEGFKSFSEKTHMGFQPGISVIIGDNGAGKSNILDAIVWALGENDIEHIRCCRQDEIFFAGSKDHPPANRASVELVFCRGRKDDTNPIRFRREVHIDGTDTFFIAGQPYEYSEYRRRLAEFNLDHALRTIIRQEQINDILLQNPVLRLKSICSILNLASLDEFEGTLTDLIAEDLRRYMLYLMPNALAALDLSSRNGHKGLDVIVTLPGNRVRSAHQLSGGEKAITSLALKLSIFNRLKNPFYLMDEVEPALDYTRHKSMQAFLKDVAAETQLIMITHLRSTIELADTLHGVRTRWDGSSFMKFYFDMDDRLLRLYECC